MWLESYLFFEEVSITHPNSKIPKIMLILLLFFPSNMPLSEMLASRNSELLADLTKECSGCHNGGSTRGGTALRCDLQNSIARLFFAGSSHRGQFFGVEPNCGGEKADALSYLMPRTGGMDPSLYRYFSIARS